MLHFQTHPEYRDDCQPCKWATISLSAAQIARERRGEGMMKDDTGTRAYVDKMYADRRAAGLSDPVPSNNEAAKFAPAIGTAGGKAYRKINGGL